MIALIAAMPKNRVIGKNNTIPWKIPEDLKHFKNVTMGKTVMMGRKTFDSIGKPLSGRKNVIITRSQLSVENADVCSSIDEGMEKAKSYGKDIFVIGGGKIYEQTINMADKLYISYVKKSYEGDTYFPEFNEKEWSIERREDKSDFELVIYARVKG